MDFLVYVDPSPRGAWALDAARQVAKALRARCLLLATAEDAAADPRLLSRAEAQLAAAGVSCAVATRPGPAERAVLAASREAAYSMVIVPPAGRRALARLFKGSRVATVVRDVQATVLVARRPAPALKRVLVAVAGGVHSPCTVLGALEVADALAAELSVVHVQSTVELPQSLPLIDRRAPDAALEEVSRRFDTVERVNEVLAKAGRPPRVTLRQGLVVDELLSEIEEGAHDLLVIGAHRAQGKRRFLLDDVTERILLRSPIPVLVVRGPEPEPGAEGRGGSGGGAAAGA